MIRTLLRVAFAFTLALYLPHTVFAEQAKAAPPKSLGTFGSWKAFTYGGEKPVCYMTMSPHFAANKKMRRGEAYLMITHRPAENTKNVVSYISGYSFKSTSDANFAIGGKSFDLFTQKDTAWSRDAATDRALATAIRDGSKLKVTGTPSAKDGAPVVDTIDLKGAAAAYAAIGKACGLPEEKKPVAQVKAKKPAVTKKKH